jgi:ribosomal protein S6--L-glutamate ligase
MKKIGVIGIAGGWSTDKLFRSIEERTGGSVLFQMEEVYFDGEKDSVFCGDKDLSEFDALIIKKIGADYSPDYLDRLEILRYLSERKGVRIFSKPERIIRILDRLSCTITLQCGGIPVPPTIVTEDIDVAIDTVKRFKETVFKPLYSTKAKGMKIITTDDNIRSEVKEFKESGNRIMYIQKKLNIPEQDFGMVFIGGEYKTTYARVKQGTSWNTTINSGGKYRQYQPSDEMISLAKKAQELFGLDFTCVDMVDTDEGLFVFEVSAFGGFRGLRDAYGIDAAGLYVDYVLKELEKNE